MIEAHTEENGRRRRYGVKIGVTMYMEQIYPAVWKITFGMPDQITPHTLLADNSRAEQLRQEPRKELPLTVREAHSHITPDGCLVQFPVREEETFYGLGLQLSSFRQNGSRKTLRTNADPVADTGDSHAPIPFFLSSAGYGVLVDTARNTTFDFGASVRLRQFGDGQRSISGTDKSGTDKTGTEGNMPGTTEKELYVRNQRQAQVSVFVKGIRGLTFYIFTGGNIRHTTELYNLFCGGGCLPPLWGLGTMYRCYTWADQTLAEELLHQFERENMPVSMFGLEPGWHSHSYSCSFTFSQDRFPQPHHLFALAEKTGRKINVWEQAYVHPSADIYESILPYSGDYEVWNGAVPDFAMKEAVEIYGEGQRRLIEQGVSGVKLDECDGADYTGGWFFPEYASFPSGLNGEEEKNLYGALAMRAVGEQFKRKGRRTFSQIRSNYSYGAPWAFALYSDLYDHRQFVRGIVNAGFSGLLWSPEVRQCGSGRELVRRMQTAVFSPFSMVNAWMVTSPPWKQFDRELNLAGKMLEDDTLQRTIRLLMELRNQLIPYFYTAYYDYYRYGTPVCRPLVMDFPEDPAVKDTDDAYMAGSCLLVAPMYSDENKKDIYLPKGEWYDFWNHSKYEGERICHWNKEEIPVFVRGNSLLAMAEETAAPGEDTVFHLKLYSFGKEETRLTLIEDDGISEAYREGAQVIGEIRRQGGTIQIPEMSRYKVTEIIEI